MANELIAVLIPSTGYFNEDASPYTAIATELSCLNTGADSVSSIDWDLNGVYQSNIVIDLSATEGAILLNPSMSTTDLQTFSLSGYKSGDASVVYTGSTTGQFYAAIDPTIDFTIGPNSLTGLGVYTRTTTLASTAGSWAINTSATDWSFNGTETYNTSSIQANYSKNGTYVVSISGYDIYGNKGTASKTLVGQSISGLMIPVSANTNTILNPEYLDAKFYINNTTDITLSSYEYSVDGSDSGLTVGDITPYTNTFINPQFNNPATTIGTHTAWVTGYGKGLADYSVISGTILLALPSAPTLSVSSNTISGEEPFTASFVALPTAGTWSVDSSATSWDFGDGSLSANIGLSAEHTFTAEVSVDTYTITASAYDIYGNGVSATWIIGDPWTPAERTAEGIRKWLLGYGKGDKGIPLT